MAERSISIDSPKSLKKFFFQWEWLLVIIFIVVNVINGVLSPYYLDFGSLIGATNSFLDMAFLVLPMVFVIILAVRPQGLLAKTVTT